MSGATKPDHLEVSYINTTALILDMLVAGGTVPVHALTQSLTELEAMCANGGYGQSVAHMQHFREFLEQRAVQRAAAQSLMQEPPEGSA